MFLCVCMRIAPVFVYTSNHTQAMPVVFCAVCERNTISINMREYIYNTKQYNFNLQRWKLCWATSSKYLLRFLVCKFSNEFYGVARLFNGLHIHGNQIISCAALAAQCCKVTSLVGNTALLYRTCSFFVYTRFCILKCSNVCQRSERCENL